MGFHEELVAEKGRLLRRLQKIDRLLDEYEGQPLRRPQRFEHKGLRGQILKVMDGNHDGLRPIQVTSLLLESGYQDDTKVPLKRRVPTEMGVMFKDGLLDREGGIYTIHEGE